MKNEELQELALFKKTQPTNLTPRTYLPESLNCKSFYDRLAITLQFGPAQWEFKA